MLEGFDEHQTKHRDLKYQVAPLGWQRDIGQTTLQFRRSDNSKTALDNRISSHVKIYTEVLSVDNVVILAHRNFVTIFTLQPKFKRVDNEKKEVNFPYKKKTYCFKQTIRFLSHCYPNRTHKVELAKLGERRKSIEEHETYRDNYLRCKSYLIVVEGAKEL